MKIIDLLNKIANGEEVPDAIKWGCHEFEWFVYEYKAKGEFGEPTLLDYLAQCPQMLNDRIITFNKVEEPKGIPEKLPIGLKQTKDGIFNTIVKDDIQYELNEKEEIICNKINEILDYLESKGDK